MNAASNHPFEARREHHLERKHGQEVRGNALGRREEERTHVPAPVKCIDDDVVPTHLLEPTLCARTHRGGFVHVALEGSDGERCH